MPPDMTESTGDLVFPENVSVNPRTVYCWACSNELTPANRCTLPNTSVWADYATMRNNYCASCVGWCAVCELPMVRHADSVEVTRRFRNEYGLTEYSSCDDCLVFCGYCDRNISREDAMDVINSRGHGLSNVCPRCRIECPSCHTWLLRGSDYCPRCDDYVENTGMHSYGFKPRPDFRGADDNPYPGLFMGMELELESVHGREEEVEEAIEIVSKVDKTRLLYCKEDGSLDCGVEIVSHPMSLPYYFEQYPWELWDPANGMRSKVHAHANAGVHIHVSREAFDRAHMYRFMAFHFLHPNFIEKIAGRESNHYTNVRPMSLTGGHVNPTEKLTISTMSGLAKDTRREYDRYWAVNPTNADTLELRYFRSTTDPRRLRMYGEWVEALFNYSNSGWIRSRRPERVLTPTNMRAWLDTQPSGKYDVLRSYFERLGV